MFTLVGADRYFCSDLLWEPCKGCCFQGRNYNVNWGGGGGGLFIHIFIYARRVSFQIKFKLMNLKRNRRQEHEYMNIHPPTPINVLVSALVVFKVAQCLSLSYEFN